VIRKDPIIEALEDELQAEVVVVPRRSWRERLRGLLSYPPGRLYWAAFAAVCIVAGVLGYGLAALTTPDPAPVAPAPTVTLDVPPACREIAAEVQAERAAAAQLADAHERALVQSEAYGAAVLSIDPDRIEKEAKALDNAMRDEQDLRIGAADYQTATDATISDCLQEESR
jgi:hypothetical protein